MENAQQLILTKESNKSQVKAYFEKVCQLHDSGEPFPVDLNTSWMCIHGTKGHAVRSLKNSFIKDIDYCSFTINGKREKGGTLIKNYKLTIKCFEFFVARKHELVFEVYRQVFHAARKGELKSSEKGIFMPDFSDPVEAALAWAAAEKIKRKAIKELAAEKAANEILKPKAEHYDSIIDTKGAIEMSKVAKVLDFDRIGRNNLFKILREEKILKFDNEPKQEYINAGYFRLVEVPYFNTKYLETRVSFQTLVYQKGMDFIRKRLIKLGYNQNPPSLFPVTIN